MKDFNISMSTAQQATTWFLLANGIMVPISAYLATKFPTQMALCYGICNLTNRDVRRLSRHQPQKQWAFLAGRILCYRHGITMPLMQVALVNMFPAKQMGAIMGVAGIAIVLAPALE